jgi:hypothetical protein
VKSSDGTSKDDDQGKERDGNLVNVDEEDAPLSKENNGTTNFPNDP